MRINMLEGQTFYSCDRKILKELPPLLSFAFCRILSGSQLQHTPTHSEGRLYWTHKVASMDRIPFRIVLVYCQVSIAECRGTVSSRCLMAEKRSLWSAVVPTK